MQNNKECYGVVILLDFLGVSLFNNEECKRFLKIRNEIMDHIDNAEPLLRENTGDLGKSLPDDFKIKSFAFGDNLMITIDLGIDSKKFLDENIYEAYKIMPIPYISHFVSRSFIYAMENKYIFRGAISIGNFIESRNNENDVSVIREAVADAAAWHEKADWGGVIFTPKASYYLDGIQLNYKLLRKEEAEIYKNIQYQSYLKYPVPIKASQQKELWAIAWPSQLFLDSKNRSKIESQKYIHLLLSEMPITKGTEEKYENTLNFALNYLKNITDENINEIKHRNADVYKKINE